MTYNQLLRDYINRGTHPDFSLEKNSRISSFNKIVALGVILLIPFLIINITFNKPEVLVVNVFSFVLCIVTSYLNKKRFNDEAIFVFLHTSVFALLSYHYVLGPGARLEYFCFTYFVCIYTCYGKNHIKLALYYTLITAVTYVIIHNSETIFPQVNYNHSSIYIELMSYFVFSAAVTGCIAAPLIFDFENKKREYRLLRSKNETEKILKQKTTFFSMLSHEIRTPLHGIIGLSELLSEKKSLPKNVIEKLNVINFSAKNLKNIIGDILDYSKIEEGTLNITLSKFNPSQLVQDVTGSHKLRAEIKNLHFRVNTTLLPPNITTDELRLSQVLNILIDNAIKFTYNGSINIDIEYSPKSDTNGILNICVSDTGIGIPDEEQEGVFNPYSQVHSSSTRNQEGTGLGLAICKNITTLLDGELKLKSKVGKGTSITVSIPVTTSSIQQTKSELQREDSKLFGLKGLLVEDNTINQFVCEEVFKTLGISYDLVSNGQNAINKCEEKKYDFIIMDYHMPQMDGFITSKKIRKNEERNGKARTPILISTADSFGTSPEEYQKYNIDGHLIKPFTKKDLTEAITNLKHKYQFKTNLMEGVTMLGQISFSGNQIDFPYIKKLFHGDLDSANQLISMVIDAIPKQLNEISSYKNKEEENRKKIITLVHNLKSNFRNIGAKNFSLALQIAEDSLRKNEDFITLWQSMRLVEQHYHLINKEKERFTTEV